MFDKIASSLSGSFSSMIDSNANLGNAKKPHLVIVRLRHRRALLRMLPKKAIVMVDHLEQKKSVGGFKT